MPVPVRIPKLGMTMQEATLVRWLVAAGERVELKKILAEIESDKIVSDLESPASGTLAVHTAAPGDVVGVAHTVAWILLDGETADEIPADTRTPDSHAPPTQPATPTSCSPGTSQQAPASSSIATRPTTSPAVRRLARELGVDVSTVVGSARDGRIVREDILHAARQPSTTSDVESAIEPLSATRRAIASTVARSSSIPAVFLCASADVSSLVAYRKATPEVAYDDFIVLAAAKALQAHAYLHASYENETIRLYKKAHIGLAVAIDQGLLIPVIRDAGALTLEQIGVERRRLVELVRTRRITDAHTRGGTFTITNLGMWPVEHFQALINPPQAAILSVGRIQDVATPVDGGGAVFRQRMSLGLTLDHRVADGAAGAAFLKDLIAHIENMNLEAKPYDN